MSKVLVDTNIFIYGIDQDSQFFPDERRILESEYYHLSTTSKNISEFLAVVTRKSGYNLEPETALEIVDEIIQGVNVLYPNHESLSIFLE